jgi:hypothetical protein
MANPKGRIAEQRYALRARKLRSKRKKRSSRTPWKRFFDAGVGAVIKTEIARGSIHSIIYTYGREREKRFVCSFEEQDGYTFVRINAIKSR